MPFHSISQKVQFECKPSKKASRCGNGFAALSQVASTIRDERLRKAFLRLGGKGIEMGLKNLWRMNHGALYLGKALKF